MLMVSEGDEVEIIKYLSKSIISSSPPHFKIRASEIKNHSNGRNDTSWIGGGSILSPTIRGFVKNINARGKGGITSFEIVQGLGPLEVSLRRLTREAANFFEPELAQRCIMKIDSEDARAHAYVHHASHYTHPAVNMETSLDV